MRERARQIKKSEWETKKKRLRWGRRERTKYRAAKHAHTHTNTHSRSNV